MKTETAKKIFEEGYQKSISLPSWYRIKSSIVKVGIDLNSNSLRSVGSFYRYRKCFAKSLSLNEILTAYKEACKRFNNHHSVNGRQIFDELSNTTKAHATTIIRWFRKTSKGGFSKQYQYNTDDLITVYFSAFLYTQRGK